MVSDRRIVEKSRDYMHVSPGRVGTLDWLQIEGEGMIQIPMHEQSGLVAAEYS